MDSICDVFNMLWMSFGDALFLAGQGFIFAFSFIMIFLLFLGLFALLYVVCEFIKEKYTKFRRWLHKRCSR